MGVGSWLASTGDGVPNVYRVLKQEGYMGDGWKTSNPAFPADADGVRQRLEEEGVHFNADGRADREQLWEVKDWRPDTTE